ncbi:hypothetical protein [Metabacillus rhizolycopersici]|uniref:Uncharacterized protein n=1 Tax=Metabacillus rhizolycopersici TaxID=2875709 RepID=A0ABS7UVD6_9BACI|nr:hypothetical protein [Metabacillus rhizolycopersici]MBZ5751982.1 hypothetical protein [Metabacillus rhizolycopersici]
MSKMKDPTQLQQKIIFFKAELAKYKAKIEDYENNYHYSQLKLLKQENLKLKEEKELNASLLNKNNDIEKLTNAITNYQEIISTFEENQENDRIKIRNMNKAILSLHTRLTLKQTDIENVETKNMNLQTENHKQKELISHYQTMNKDLSIQIEQLHKDIQTYKDEKKEFEKISNNLKDKNRKLDTYITEIERKQQADKQLHQEQNEQINQLQNDLQHLTNRKEELKKENLDLLEEISNLKSVLEKLEKTENMRSIKFNNLQSQLGHYQKKLEEAQTVQQQFEKLNTNLQKESSSLLSKNHNLHQKVEVNDKHMKELNEKIQELQKVNRRNLTLIDTYNWFKDEIIHLKRNQDGIINKIGKIQIDISSFSSIISLLTNENNQFSTLTLLEQQFKEILEHSFDYEEKLDSKSLLINELENKLEDFTNEIESLQNNIYQKKSHPKKKRSE